MKIPPKEFLNTLKIIIFRYYLLFFDIKFLYIVIEAS